MNEKGAKDNYLPVQMIFCLKEKNKKKVNFISYFKYYWLKKIILNYIILLNKKNKLNKKKIKLYLYVLY